MRAREDGRGETYGLSRGLGCEGISFISAYFEATRGAARESLCNDRKAERKGCYQPTRALGIFGVIPGVTGTDDYASVRRRRSFRGKMDFGDDKGRGDTCPRQWFRPRGEDVSECDREMDLPGLRPARVLMHSCLCSQRK